MSSSTESALDALLASLAGAVVYDLEQPRHPDMPVFPAHRPGYFYLLHRRHGLHRHADIAADVAWIDRLAAAQGSLQQVPAPQAGIARLPDVLAGQTGDCLDAALTTIRASRGP